MHDTGAIVSSYEVTGQHPANVTGSVKVIKQSAVVKTQQFAALYRFQYLEVVVAQHLRDSGLCQDQGFSTDIDIDIINIGAHGEREVGWQCPRRGGPDKERYIVIDKLEADRDRRVNGFAVALCDLMGRQRCADSRIVGDDLVILIDEAPIPDLF